MAYPDWEKMLAERRKAPGALNSASLLPKAGMAALRTDAETKQLGMRNVVACIAPVS